MWSRLQSIYYTQISCPGSCSSPLTFHEDKGRKTPGTGTSASSGTGAVNSNQSASGIGNSNRIRGGSAGGQKNNGTAGWGWKSFKSINGHINVFNLFWSVLCVAYTDQWTVISIIDWMDEWMNGWIDGWMDSRG